MLRTFAGSRVPGPDVEKSRGITVGVNERKKKMSAGITVAFSLEAERSTNPFERKKNSLLFWFNEMLLLLSASV